ncbi:MAG TPA: hypothetical protein VI172_18330 [Candidatus Dormibacteraeota bacterium]
MSAYSDAFQALTRNRALRPDEAAVLLARLRKETGQDLAAAVEQTLSGKYVRTATDTDGSFRLKRRKYAAAMAVVNTFRHLAATTSLPHQRNRSTS